MTQLELNCVVREFCAWSRRGCLWSCREIGDRVVIDFQKPRADIPTPASGVTPGFVEESIERCKSQAQKWSDGLGYNLEWVSEDIVIELDFEPWIVGVFPRQACADGALLD